jgi:excisionase family DNA binding protein
MNMKKLYRPDEVATILALSKRTVYRMLQDGRLHGVKIHGTRLWRIPKETLEAILYP